MTGTGREPDGLPQSRVLLVSCSTSHWTATQSHQPTALRTPQLVNHINLQHYVHHNLYTIYTVMYVCTGLFYYCQYCS